MECSASLGASCLHFRWLSFQCILYQSFSFLIHISSVINKCMFMEYQWKNCDTKKCSVTNRSHLQSYHNESSFNCNDLVFARRMKSATKATILSQDGVFFVWFLEYESRWSFNCVQINCINAFRCNLWLRLWFAR